MTNYRIVGQPGKPDSFRVLDVDATDSVLLVDERVIGWDGQALGHADGRADGQTSRAADLDKWPPGPALWYVAGSQQPGGPTWIARLDEPGAGLHADLDGVTLRDVVIVLSLLKLADRLTHDTEDRLWDATARTARRAESRTGTSSS